MLETYCRPRSVFIVNSVFALHEGWIAARLRSAGWKEVLSGPLEMGKWLSSYAELGGGVLGVTELDGTWMTWRLEEVVSRQSQDLVFFPKYACAEVTELLQPHSSFVFFGWPV